MRTTIVIAASASLLLAGLASNAAGPGAAPWLRTPKGWDIPLVSPGEPGGTFVMEGRVLGNFDLPMAGLTLYVYHVDRNGYYASKDDPNGFVRIAGVLKTDSSGRYRIRSILPGQYEGPAHVHFEAWGPGQRAHAWFVNLYMGPQEKPDSAWGRMATVRRSTMESNRPETFVSRDERGTFHARYDLRWNRSMRMPAHFDSVRRGLTGSRP